MNVMKVLAISGSLREASSNTAVLRALVALAPPGIEVSLHPPLDTLPFFNADVEETSLPPSVQAWRSSIRTANAIVISSPEYAHGVSGVLKNALDWLVGGVEINGKPIAVINARPQSTIAHGAPVETLRIMGGRVVDQTALALTGPKPDSNVIVSNPKLSAILGSVLLSLRRATEEYENAINGPV
jgi:chromate reductase